MTQICLNAKNSLSKNICSLLRLWAAVKMPDFSPATRLLLTRLPDGPPTKLGSQLRVRKVHRQDCIKFIFPVLRTSKLSVEGGKPGQAAGFKDFQPVDSGSRSLNF